LGPYDHRTCLRRVIGQSLAKPGDRVAIAVVVGWLSEGPRGPPLAFRTVHESFPSHGSSVAGPWHGHLVRPSAAGTVPGCREAWKLRVGSLQAPRSGSRWGGNPHSYRDVTVGLMTYALRLAPLPASHRGPRRRIPTITAGPWLLGPSHPPPGVRFGSPCSAIDHAESPGRVTTFLMLVLCSRRVALSAGLEAGEWPVGNESAGPQSLSLFGPAWLGGGSRPRHPSFAGRS